MLKPKNVYDTKELTKNIFNKQPLPFNGPNYARTSSSRPNYFPIMQRARKEKCHKKNALFLFLSPRSKSGFACVHSRPNLRPVTSCSRDFFVHIFSFFIPHTGIRETKGRRAIAGYIPFCFYSGERERNLIFSLSASRLWSLLSISLSAYGSSI